MSQQAKQQTSKLACTDGTYQHTFHKDSISTSESDTTRTVACSWDSISISESDTTRKVACS